MTQGRSHLSPGERSQIAVLLRWGELQKIVGVHIHRQMQ